MRLETLALVITLALGSHAACSDSDSGSDSGTDTTGPAETTAPTETTTGGEEATPSGTTSALTGVDTGVTVTAPTPNPACSRDQVDRGDHGASYPWGGLTAGGTTYTCNKCPTGLSTFQGMWRAHGFADDGLTPDFSKGASASDDAEILFIDGNTWYSRMHDQQSGRTVESRGWFFCSQKPEHPNEHLFWVTVEPNAGRASESDVILSQGDDLRLIFWYDEVGGGTGISIGYCKIGSQAGGVSCNNPFE